MVHARSFVLTLLALFALAGTAQAQASYITGTVTDAVSGAPLVGAQVEVTTTTGTVARGMTDERGLYRASNVTPGTYSVIFRRLGYRQQVVEGVVVPAGGPASLSVSMTATVVELNPTTISVSRRVERANDAPASVSVISETEINERVVPSVVDHVRALPGVDVASGGILQANVVARGFNNVFSGSLLTITDNRFAFVPSLRVNVPYLSATTNEDIERIEVVLGPGAALYGPNAANGVMHIVTKSPFTSQGTTLTVDAGERSYLRTGIRHAGAPTERIGYKLSFDMARGNDWESVDPQEPVQRSFDLERWGGEARLDFRPTPGTEIIGSYGRSTAGSALEPTGLGAAQVRDWSFDTYQLRAIRDRTFAQVFFNKSDAGETFLLRNANRPDGGLIVDKSTQLVAQLQQGIDFGTRSELLFGLDHIRTNPVTEGTITGRNEEDDDVVETGAYVHTTTRLSSMFEVVGALRYDVHSRLDDAVWSPRAALVFKPTELQNIRLTYNRAFSTPSTNNMFLDLLAGQIPIPPTPGYDVRTLGTPQSGLQFARDCVGGVGGGLCMRSPFVPGGSSAFIPANALVMYNAAVAAVGPSLPPIVQTMLNNTTTPAFDAQRAAVGTQLRVLNPTAGTFHDVAPSDVRDLDAIVPTITTGYEVGYKGILGDRVRLAVDLWQQKKTNFVGPLIVETPNVFLDRASLTTFLAAAFQAQGMDAATAAATAGQVGAAMAGIDGSTAAATKGVPLGVVNFDNALSTTPGSNASNIVLAYRNFGEVEIWGSDLALELLLTDRVALLGAYSYVNKDFFSREEVGGVQDIALNAPRNKGSLAARFRDENSGFGGELRARFVQEFPFNSGVYIGDVPTYRLYDASINFRPAMFNGVLVSVNATNLRDNKHIQYAGGATIGRMIMTRLQYSF
jgi:outer membrane receptor for ferrienterochelin and colicins